MKQFKPSWLPKSRLPPRERKPEPIEHDESLQGFYQSREWKDVRALKKQSNPLCEDCLSRGVVKPVQVVHHVLPVRTHPEFKLSLDNLLSACYACHNRSHPEKGKARQP